MPLRFRLQHRSKVSVAAWHSFCGSRGKREMSFCSRRRFRKFPRSARISHSPTSCFASRTDFCACIAPPAHTSKPWPLVPCSGTPFARARRLRTEHAGCESVPPGTCHDAGGRRARASRSGIMPIGIQSAAASTRAVDVGCDPARRATRGAAAAHACSRGLWRRIRSSREARPSQPDDQERCRGRQMCDRATRTAPSDAGKTRGFGSRLPTDAGQTAAGSDNHKKTDP